MNAHQRKVRRAEIEAAEQARIDHAVEAERQQHRSAMEAERQQHRSAIEAAHAAMEAERQAHRAHVADLMRSMRIERERLQDALARVFEESDGRAALIHSMDAHVDSMRDEVTETCKVLEVTGQRARELREDNERLRRELARLHEEDRDASKLRRRLAERTQDLRDAQAQIHLLRRRAEEPITVGSMSQVRELLLRAPIGVGPQGTLIKPHDRTPADIVAWIVALRRVAGLSTVFADMLPPPASPASDLEASASAQATSSQET